MAYVDLRQGVADLFEEAQRLVSKPRAVSHLRSGGFSLGRSRAWHTVPAPKDWDKWRESLRATADRAREKAARNPRLAFLQPLAIPVGRCPLCGAQVERREGCEKPTHYGRCLGPGEESVYARAMSAEEAEKAFREELEAFLAATSQKGPGAGISPWEFRQRFARVLQKYPARPLGDPQEASAEGEQPSTTPTARRPPGGT